MFCFQSYLAVSFHAVFSAWQISVYFIWSLSPQETESHRLYKQAIRRDLICPKTCPPFLTLSNIGTVSDKLGPLTSLIIVDKSPQFLPQHIPPAVITWGMVLYLQLMDFNSPGDTSHVRDVLPDNRNSLFYGPRVKSILKKITQKTLLHWTTYVLPPNSGKKPSPYFIRSFKAVLKGKELLLQEGRWNNMTRVVIKSHHKGKCWVDVGGI